VWAEETAPPPPASGKAPVTAALACYNEAHYLEASLPRLDFCDEVLVVDLGSEDQSIAVARAHGARVLEHEWVPFRERIVQWMLEEAGHDWVLFCDPDLVLPAGVGERIHGLLAAHTPEGLGMVYLPMVTCFGPDPLRYGQKSGRRAYRALVHRQRVQLADLLHHKGVQLDPDSRAVCLRPQGDADLIRHYWIDNWQDAMAKARRYLPYEGRTRAAVGQRFSWGGLFGELLASLRADVRRMAFLEWRASQVMLFQLWYTWKANLALRDHGRGAQGQG
jgi:glycosyltransferase involved in cell wall biosynthesis